MNNEMCMNVDKAVEDWYGLANTSILSIPQDIVDNKEINKTKVPSGLSIAYFLNLVFKISSQKTITIEEKRTLYNLYQLIKYFFSIFYNSYFFICNKLSTNMENLA